MEEDFFCRFNRTNLVNEISKRIKIDRKILSREVKEYIWPRLDFLHGKNRTSAIYYIFEESYTETEWKDMVSVHYINTSYEVQNTVMRIHLFIAPTLNSDNYIGFFTLRKINEARIMLSFIYPNWANIFYGDQRLCVMTYTKKVHIMGRELILHTYPLFVQDNITVACTQVSMISMTTYLHEKFDYHKIRILNLNDLFSIGKTKTFPTSGLTPAQMIEIFNAYDIPMGQCVTKPENQSLEQYKQCHNYIDYTVESSIPVILGMQIKNQDDKIQSHAIQIIGHAQQDRNKYVIYDDSGYFLRNVMGEEGFVAVIEWETLEKNMKSGKSFILYPIHEKVYLMYDAFKESYTHFLENLNYISRLEQEGIFDKENVRLFLADNRDVKRFLINNVLSGMKEDSKSKEIELQKKEIEKMLRISMPHYVWICELPVEDRFFIFIADSTYGKSTIKHIFYNEIPISVEEQFGLLNYT